MKKNCIRNKYIESILMKTCDTKTEEEKKN